MKKPDRTWLVFGLCVAAASAALGWLSLHAIELDARHQRDRAETELARQEAELQERINSSLYRMDLKLLPLVAQQSARLDVSRPPSPLVKLSFFLASNNQVLAPPRSTTMPSAEPSGAVAAVADQTFDFAHLLDRVPPIDTTPPADTGSTSNNYQVPIVDQAVSDIAAVQHQRDDSSLHPSRSSPPSLPATGKLAIQQSRGLDRSVQEFTRRNQLNAGMNYGNSISLSASKGADDQPPSHPSEIGIMQPVWIGQELVLARRVRDQDGLQIQISWLDWQAIQVALRDEVVDLLPDVVLEPVRSESDLNLSAALTTLPIQLSLDKERMLAALDLNEYSEDVHSGLPLALTLAWCGLGVAVLAIAWLLRGVMRLSERRATFASAVTHELRTPLTTFRMYTEMLAENMVPPEKQSHYLSTLKSQADRLSDLVENVLQFARLERQGGKLETETIAIADLMARFSDRLNDRANSAGLQLAVEFPEQVGLTEVNTQVLTVEQILFNLVDNACKHGVPSTSEQIEIVITAHSRCWRIVVRDHGPGVAPHVRGRMFQPFCKSDQEAANSAPGVGLGLALCQRMAASLRGRLYHVADRDGNAFVLELPWKLPPL
ncbi:sensor histidine kinase [Allorhodopirellula solitaria]|uniref:histidine kinase n=1 Tax=Allorhodopirellula solitaria TaxID=2527987 RepID=A0A5C5XYR3_9BACT|nr:HAMP domain-containing sensor histidine kinase [Allorhodopirellula solitaria]TWT67423.1 Alkaline phosphatase synthesis sensor protein PhoR [Allorhodopirellula solitaria]